MRGQHGDEQQIETLHDAGLTIQQIARATGRGMTDVRTVVAGIVERRRQSAADLLAQQRQYQPVTLGRPDTGDAVMVTADMHIPQTDWRLVERMMAIAKLHMRPPRTLVVAGDFLSEDRFSQFSNIVPPAPWAVERDTAREVISALLDVFDAIWFAMGNRDRRMIKWADAALDEGDLFGMLTSSAKVKITKHAYINIETENGLWTATHPAFYRSTRGSGAAALADRLGCHVISGHEHHTAITFSPSGKFLAVNVGGMYDPAKIAYAALTHSLKPVMIPSFAMLQRGRPYLFADTLTDWERWGC